MVRFRITLGVFWYWWCCWSFSSHQLGVKCELDELEDFPLDSSTNADANVNANATVYFQRNSFTHSDVKAVEAEDNIVDLNEANGSESYGTSASQDRIVSFNKMMASAMREPSIRSNFGQVLPIIRAMSPTQRLTLATLVLKQLASTAPSSSIFSQSNLQQLSDKSAELLLPISVDIATMLQSLNKNATTIASHGGRSTTFGAYYYNPPSAGYRMNNNQRPPALYSTRRRIQTSINERKKADIVPPEMMPPPYVPSANVSYANFDNKKQSQSFDKDDGHDYVHIHSQNSETEDENNEENTDEENYDFDNDSNKGISKNQEQCEVFDETICYDETYSSYPSDRIANSIRNLQHKRVFAALVQDFIQNATTEQSTEIERRFGSVIPSSSREDALQLCASKIKFARPKKAKSTTGNWKFIVNTEHYTQTVRIESCLNSDKTCSFLNENVKSQCVQVYNYHRLLTWDEKSGLSLDLFKIPTCCSCQVQQANVNAFSQVTKNFKQSQLADNGLHDNVIIHQSNVEYAPTVTKSAKMKNKFNFTSLPLTTYNTPKRNWFGGGSKLKRPLHPAVLPLQHLDSGGGDGGDVSGIRRTSSKANILKGVYMPGRGTPTEYTVPTADAGASIGGTLPHRVNYNYHPIIDFFRSTPAAGVTLTPAADRIDTNADALAADEWLPVTDGPRFVRTRRSAAQRSAARHH